MSDRNFLKMNNFSEGDAHKEEGNTIATFPVPFTLEEVQGKGKTKKNISISTNNSLSKQDAINQAINLHSQGNIKEAIKYYQYCINQNFNDPIIFSNYAIILKELGKLKEAEILVRKAIDIKPNYAEAHLNLGNILKGLGKFKEAEILVRKAIQIKPNYAEAHNNLGNILSDLGDLKEAEVSQRKAIKLKSDFAMAHFNLGSILQDLGNLKEAEISTRKAINLKPDFAMAHANLGTILKGLKRFDEAISSFNQAYNLCPENQQYVSMAGLKPNYFYRKSLTKNIDLVRCINQGNLELSEKFLIEICTNYPTYTKANVDEYIILWCNFSNKLIIENNIRKLVPIFLHLIMIGERNNNLNQLIQNIFDKYTINSILELVEGSDKILIKLSYSQYKYDKKQFLEVETLAVDNIKNGVNLIKNKKTEDLGWLITRRSLSLFTKKDLARKHLIKLIKDLQY